VKSVAQRFSFALRFSISFALLAVCAVAAQESHGRLFPPQDLGLLEGPDRDAWQKPDQIMDALAIADGAAEAGALALASGRSATVATRDALPGWGEDARVTVRGGRVTVRLRPPSLDDALAEKLEVTGSAFARPR
jgi:hypothetical protein